MWPLAFAPVYELEHLLLAFVLQQPLFDLDPLCSQCGDSSTTNGRIGIGGSDYHVGNSSPQKCLSAGRGPAEVVARLQSDIGGSTCGGNASRLGVCDCHLLCVQPADVVMPPFSNYAPITDQHAPYQWVGHHAPSATLRQLEGATHENLLSVHLSRTRELPSTHHFLY